MQKTESKYNECRKQSESADQEYDRLIARTRDARLGKEFADACLLLFQNEARLQELQTSLTQVSELEKKLSGIEGNLARLVPLEEEEFRALQDLAVEIGRAEAALGAMATEIEVVDAPGPVSLGGESVSRGDKRTFTEPTMLQVGPVQVRIFPGGGDRLAQARKELRSRTEEPNRLWITRDSLPWTKRLKLLSNAGICKLRLRPRGLPSNNGIPKAWLTKSKRPIKRPKRPWPTYKDVLRNQRRGAAPPPSTKPSAGLKRPRAGSALGRPRRTRLVPRETAFARNPARWGIVSSNSERTWSPTRAS